MVPVEFANFFLACAGAGGALIGLLFVAVSINPERIFGKAARRERQAVATSAFSALVNSFFVSTTALLPGVNLGGVALVFATQGILNTVGVARRLVTYQIQRYRGSRDLALRIARSLFVVAGSLILYGFQLSDAVDLVRHKNETGDVTALAVLVLATYGLGLTRAWELLGAPRSGITGWLNPLADLDESEPAAAPAPDSDQPARDGQTARPSRLGQRAKEGR
jgi:hypothetical protein